MLLLNETVPWQQDIIAVMSIISPLIIVFFGLFYYRKQKKTDVFYQIEGIRYSNKLDAYKEIWSLLIYLTIQENDKTIIIRRNNESGKSENLLRKDNATEFMKKLTETFFNSGNGIFLDSNTKKLIFEYRNQLYRLLDTDRDNTGNFIKLKNEELVKRLHQIHDELISHLRTVVTDGIVEK
jgi:hypothetical protein